MFLQINGYPMHWTQYTPMNFVIHIQLLRPCQCLIEEHLCITNSQIDAEQQIDGQNTRQITVSHITIQKKQPYKPTQLKSPLPNHARRSLIVIWASCAVSCATTHESRLEALSNPTANATHAHSSELRVTLAAIISATLVPVNILPSLGYRA